jgi:hypothetical protein
MSEIQTLFIKDLTLDPKYQARSRMNPSVVKEYEENLISGVALPPIKVVKTSDKFIVVDGFHRVDAHVNVGRDRVAAEVIDGDHWTALKLAVSANQTHGLQRSREDKTRAVEMALDDFGLSCQSDRELGKLCGVSHKFIASVREKLGKERAPNKFSRKTPSLRQSKVVPAPPQENQFDETFDPRDELIERLTKEKDSLDFQVALGSMDGSPEEKNLAQQLIDDLRKQLHIANIELEAVKRSRDRFQSENSQMLRQIAWLEKRNKRLNDQLGISERLDDDSFSS